MEDPLGGALTVGGFCILLGPASGSGGSGLRVSTLGEKLRDDSYGVVDILDALIAAGWVMKGMKLEEEVVDMVDADGACETVEAEGACEECVSAKDGILEGRGGGLEAEGEQTCSPRASSETSLAQELHFTVGRSWEIRGAGRSIARVLAIVQPADYRGIMNKF
jgi:hypothetical protein